MAQIVSKYHSRSPPDVNDLHKHGTVIKMHTTSSLPLPLWATRFSPTDQSSLVRRSRPQPPALCCSVCNQYSTFQTAHHGSTPSSISHQLQILQLTASDMSPPLSHRCLKSSMTKNECIIVPAPPKNPLEFGKRHCHLSHIRHLRVFSDSSLSQRPQTVRDHSSSGNSSSLCLSNPTPQVPSPLSTSLFRP